MEIESNCFGCLMVRIRFVSCEDYVEKYTTRNGFQHN